MKMFFASLAVASVSAVAVPAFAKYETVTVCNEYDNGVVCQKVTYKVRPPSAPEPVKCTVTVGELEQPCPTIYGVPEWLQQLNQWFRDQGLEAPTQEEIFEGTL